jgi:hypothetical protein
MHIYTKSTKIMAQMWGLPLRWLLFLIDMVAGLIAYVRWVIGSAIINIGDVLYTRYKSNIIYAEAGGHDVTWPVVCQLSSDTSCRALRELLSDMGLPCDQITILMHHEGFLCVAQIDTFARAELTTDSPLIFGIIVQNAIPVTYIRKISRLGLASPDEIPM